MRSGGPTLRRLSTTFGRAATDGVRSDDPRRRYLDGFARHHCPDADRVACLADAQRLRLAGWYRRWPAWSILESRKPNQDHPEIAADNNSSERNLRPTATYRKVTGGFRSTWGADLYAAVRSTVATAAKQGIHAFDAIRATLQAVAP